MGSVSLLDANVLYPSLIRNLLMHCATSGLIAARWTNTIHEEWIRNLLTDRPDLSLERLQRTRQFMEKAVPDAEVTGYEPLVTTLGLPDPDDAHVLAAAIKAEAEFLVTFNLRDFPRELLAPHGVEALTLDDLMCRLYQAKPEATLEVLEELRRSLHNPPYTRPDFYRRLGTVGLVQFAALLTSEPTG
ncbi:hypothetical protein GCM10017783_22460 [Deinococcus piscis]|uniref:PIN domain-containing protein n=1 Tax=Deinococcus piscis TaxID=394230 RepID=A0ABQ3KCH8_9DEIO|nr:PIN domain-containing protein [Deinococcus piscis]GHG09416.1 hypothetical protein GCM10017783_22460 [Deinococcus piscis]